MSFSSFLCPKLEAFRSSIMKCMVLILSRLLSVRKKRGNGTEGTQKVVSCVCLTVLLSEFGLNFRTYFIGQFDVRFQTLIFCSRVLFFSSENMCLRI